MDGLYPAAISRPPTSPFFRPKTHREGRSGVRAHSPERALWARRTPLILQKASPPAFGGGVSAHHECGETVRARCSPLLPSPSIVYPSCPSWFLFLPPPSSEAASSRHREIPRRTRRGTFRLCPRTSAPHSEDLQSTIPNLQSHLGEVDFRALSREGHGRFAPLRSTPSLAGQPVLQDV